MKYIRGMSHNHYLHLFTSITLLIDLLKKKVLHDYLKCRVIDTIKIQS